jgi:hypothetical protein
LNMYWGNVLNLGFCAGLPHLRQALSVICTCGNLFATSCVGF